MGALKHCTLRVVSAETHADRTPERNLNAKGHG